MALIHVKDAEEFKARYIEVMADWDKWRSFNYFFFRIEDHDTLLHVEIYPDTKETHASYISFRDNDAVHGLILHMPDIGSAEKPEDITAAGDADSIISYLDRWQEQLAIFGGEEGLREENRRRREMFRKKIDESREGR